MKQPVLLLRAQQYPLQENDRVQTMCLRKLREVALTRGAVAVGARRLGKRNQTRTQAKKTTKKAKQRRPCCAALRRGTIPRDPKLTNGNIAELNAYTKRQNQNARYSLALSYRCL